MGEVFLARQRGVEGFEKPVVVKRLLPKLAHSPKLVSLFVAEAKLAARLQHRNVVQVHDLGDDKGSLYIVMEYVAGTDLAHLLRTTVAKNVALPVWFSLHVAVEMLGGLVCLHDATDERGRRLNAVHRDVSPANVFVSFQGDVKLGDFGVAKSELRDDQTRAGEVRGKIAYLSPEQIIGRNFDARADLFSAAIVLWECLAQRRLFGGRPDYQSILAITQGPRPPPSEYNEHVTPELDQLLAKALSVDPNDRYQSALELQRAVAEVQQHYGHVVVGTDVRDLLLRLSATARGGPEAASDKSLARRNTLSPIQARARRPDDHTRSLSEADVGESPPAARVVAGPVESMPAPPRAPQRPSELDAAISAAVESATRPPRSPGSNSASLPGLGPPPPPPPPPVIPPGLTAGLGLTPPPSASPPPTSAPIAVSARGRTVTPLPGSVPSLPAGRRPVTGSFALGALPGPETGGFGTASGMFAMPQLPGGASPIPGPRTAPLAPAPPPVGAAGAPRAAQPGSASAAPVALPTFVPPGTGPSAPSAYNAPAYASTGLPPFGMPGTPLSALRAPITPPTSSGRPAPAPPPSAIAPAPYDPPASFASSSPPSPLPLATSAPPAAPATFGAPTRSRSSAPAELTQTGDAWAQLGLERDSPMPPPVKPGAAPHAPAASTARPQVQVVMGQAVPIAHAPADDRARILSVADSRAAPHTPPWVHVGMVPGGELEFPPGTVHDGGYRGPAPFWLKNQDDLYWGPVGWPELAGYLSNGLERSAHQLMASADGQTWLELELIGSLLGVESWCVRSPSSMSGRLRGNLRRRSLTSVLAALWRNRETGRLVLSAEDPLTDAWRELHVIEGVPTFVTSNAPRVSLLDLLAKQHVLRADDLPRVAHTALLERIPIELAARKRGLVDVDQNLPLVVRERAVELFGWRLGQFVFEQGYMPLRVRPIARSCLALATSSLLRAGAERELLHDLGSATDKKLTPSARFEQSLPELGFNDVQLEVARMLAKGTPVNTLLRRDGVDKKALALVAYVLVESELLTPPRT